MKNSFHKIISITLAILLLASTTSWKVEKHYCMGHLVDIAFFTDVEACGMDMSSSVTSDMQKENSCCSDEVVIIDGQDNLKISFDNLSLDKQVFLLAFSHSYIDLFKGGELKNLPQEQYPPPILVKDIQLLDQVFLI